ncbi:UNKNOWN [Stylonychia lemnae]|uniref:Uncharacterized protein n=1 Tax=Stylonychia lemnae TaxID=5949 RepID=A0A077ZMC6_STYLE|nr:UNKNOWN [Stylonychia lemnae]|eukprot:CDW71132.1 UNKNOWN [Stylonychia lemnae]
MTHRQVYRISIDKQNNSQQFLLDFQKFSQNDPLSFLQRQQKKLNPESIQKSALSVPSIRVPDIFICSSFDVIFNNQHTPGIASLFKPYDFYLSQQLDRIMSSYSQLLMQLKRTYQFLLRTQKDYEKSFEKNEDGFFLNLYKYINECQIHVSSILEKYFLRQRVLLITSRGGYTNCPISVYINLKTQQDLISESVLSQIYFMPFEFFPVKEELFRQTLIKELAVSDLRKTLKSSMSYQIRQIGNTVITQFIKVEEDVQQLKQRKIFEGQIITNKMIYTYLDLFEKARQSLMVKQGSQRFNSQSLCFYDAPSKEQLANPESAFQILENRNLVQIRFQKVHHEAQVIMRNSDFLFMMIFDYLYHVTGITPIQARIKMREMSYKLTISQQNALDIFSLYFSLL